MDIYDYENIKLTDNFEENTAYIKDIFKNDDIFRTRDFLFKGKYKCAIFFLDGMVNNVILNESLLEPMLSFKAEPFEAALDDFILERVIYAAESKKNETVADMLSALLYGDTLLIIEGCKSGITVNTKGWRTRGISNSENEKVLWGPKEAFDEAVMLTMAMLRRKLPTPDLCVEFVKIGRRTDTRAFITYLSSIVNRKALNILKERLKKIDIDGILDANYVGELINKNKFSLFKTIGTTERPDTVASNLLEGRVALFIDGTPVVLTLPYLFSENFQSGDDYYTNYIFAFIGRILRYICFFLSISVPALYLALITHHKQLVPTDFLLTVIKSRDGVPIPCILECLLLLFIFEILRETGQRVPQSMGHALSIVGGLVVGQASVEARIVSAPTLIAVALSGIAGLMVQRLNSAVVYSRFILVLLGNYFGLFGYIAGVFTLMSIIFSLDSFGTDYTSSLIKPNFSTLKDTFFRAPWYKMNSRPYTLSENRKRQGERK